MIVKETAKSLDTYQRYWQALEQQRNKLPISFQSLQKKAWEKFQALGFPSFRDERFKYCDLSFCEKFNFSFVPQPAAATDVLKSLALEENHLVFWNGSLQLASIKAFSIEGLRIYPLLKNVTQKDEQEKIFLRLEAQVQKAADGLSVLNTAFSFEGVCIQVAAGLEVPFPIHMYYIHDTEDETCQSVQNHIDLAANSKLTMIEHHIALTQNTATFKSLQQYIHLEKNSRLSHYIYQEENQQSVACYRHHVIQEANAHYDYFSCDLGGKCVRRDLQLHLQGNAAQVHLNGLYFARDQQKVDNHLEIFHEADFSQSYQCFKGIADNHGHAIFDGAVTVAQGAKQCLAKQKNDNLLLSSTAEVDTKPALMIFNDEVACQHGATVGQLSDEALFYLRSRGLDQTMAKKVLFFGFIQSVLAAIEGTSFAQSLRLSLIRAALLPQI